jgi:hypothetical protein
VNLAQQQAVDHPDSIGGYLLDQAGWEPRHGQAVGTQTDPIPRPYAGM